VDLAQAAAEYPAGIAPRFESAGYELHATVVLTPQDLLPPP